MSSERPPRFEDALAELEAVVRRLEEGELALEESLDVYERGMALVRALTERLAAIEQRVEVLGRGSGGVVERRAIYYDDD
jgi:exodeoxyribonuclease VII small subunit